MIKIQHENKEYIYLGPAFGAYKAQGHKGWGSIPSTSQGEIFLAAITDKSGEIFFVKSDTIRIVSIDGIKIFDLFME